MEKSRAMNESYRKIAQSGCELEFQKTYGGWCYAYLKRGGDRVRVALFRSNGKAPEYHAQRAPLTTRWTHLGIALEMLAEGIPEAIALFERNEMYRATLAKLTAEGGRGRGEERILGEPEPSREGSGRSGRQAARL